MILSAEALALRRARQAQRRAQKASLQLSQQQKELVQTLLGAHTRHVGPMFDQFVQFKVRAYQVLAWVPEEVAQGRRLWCHALMESRSPKPQSGQVPQQKPLRRAR